MSETARRAYVHIGLPKTGTSYLQSILLHNLDELRSQGLTVLPEPAGLKPSIQLTLALRDRLIDRHDPEPRDVLLRQFAEQGRAASGDVLLTQEQLSAATKEQASELYSLVADREVHLVVTARTLARQVPSGWQERVKTRSTHCYADFVRAVMDRTTVAEAFWRHQDLVDVLDRWGSTIPPERVHVVTVPTAAGDPTLLLNRYCSALGVDASRLATDVSTANTSLGFVQVELLRRINQALGDRLPKPRLGYTRVAKWYFADRVLRAQQSGPPRLPREAKDWCLDLTRTWISTVQERGYDVVGDLVDLLPLDEHFGTDEATAPAEAAVTEAAVEALATMLALRAEESSQVDRLRAQIEEQKAELEHLRQRPLRLLAGKVNRLRG